MRVLIVSPHFDDAPLSLGQSMIDGALHEHRVTVGIVFGRTNWVRWFHPTRSRAPIAGAIRRAEELHAAARFRYRLRIADLEEALLRLDTDFYDSTLQELVHLWPRLVPGGIVVLDDYGYWEGQRKAVDEYFEEQGIAVFLHRMSALGSIGVKPG